MYSIRSLKRGVATFLLILSIVEIYFVLSFFTHGLFVKYGYSISSLTFAPLFFVIFLFLLAITLSLILIYHGFLHRRDMVIKFSKIFIAWSMIWPAWGLVSGLNIAEQILLLLVYLFLLILLYTSSIKEHFIKVYRFGKYTLYKREVNLKSGRKLTIYFFSEKEPKSGKPCDLPDGYRVEINKISKMPYLKKIR